MKYLSEIIYKGIYIVIPFMFVVAVAVADRTHETPPSETSSNNNHPFVGATASNVNWAERSLEQIVRALDSPIYAQRELATNELRRRLIQNYRETSTALPQILRTLERPLSTEGQRRINNLSDQGRVDWPTIFNIVKDNVLLSPESRSAKDAHDRISIALNANPNPNPNIQFSEVVKNSGYTIIQTENTPGILETLVVQRNNELFRVHFMGKGLFSIERVSRTGVNEYSRTNVRVNFSDSNLLTPLQRANLSLAQGQNLPPFSTPSADYNPLLSPTDSLGSNFIERSANYLMGIVPNHRAEIITARDRIIETQRIRDKRKD